MVILMISNLISFCLGGFIAVKCIQLGLRWKIQLENKKEPETDKSIIQKVIEKREIKKETEDRQSLVDEWLNGDKHGK